MTKKKQRRVRWRVRRCADGWLPVVLIGEEPFTMAPRASKHDARANARAKAAEISGAHNLA